MFYLYYLYSCVSYFILLFIILSIILYDQRCAYGGMGMGASCPIFSNLQESWSKLSHAAGKLATVFSVAFFGNNSSSIGQNAPNRYLSTSLYMIIYIFLPHYLVLL